MSSSTSKFESKQTSISFIIFLVSPLFFLFFLDQCTVQCLYDSNSVKFTFTPCPCTSGSCPFNSPGGSVPKIWCCCNGSAQAVRLVDETKRCTDEHNTNECAAANVTCAAQCDSTGNCNCASVAAPS